jgi:hypothetical protein
VVVNRSQNLAILQEVEPYRYISTVPYMLFFEDRIGSGLSASSFSVNNTIKPECLIDLTLS